MSPFLVFVFWLTINKLVSKASGCENLFQRVYDYDASVGIWEQKPNVVSTLDYAGCPYRDGQGFCSDTRVVHLTSYTWLSEHPDLSMSNMDAALPFLAGKTIGFVGDSMARQQVSSFLCMVWARAGNAVEKFEHSPESVTYVFDISNYTGGSSVQNGLLRIRWVWSPLGVVDEVLEGGPLDYMILNIGHHIDPTKLGAKSDWLKQYQQALLGAVKGLDAHAKIWNQRQGYEDPLAEPAALLMTNVLRHFEDGDYDTIPIGYCK